MSEEERPKKAGSKKQEVKSRKQKQKVKSK